MAEEQIPSAGDDKAKVDVDALLDELDPDFKAQLGVIQSGINEIGPITGLESISLGAEYFSEKEKGEDIDLGVGTAPKEVQKSEEVALQYSVVQISFELFKQSVILPFAQLMPIVRLILRLRTEKPLAILPDVKDALIPAFQNWLVPLLAFVKSVKSFKKKTYFKLGIIFCLLVILRLLVFDMKNHFVSDSEKDPFLKDWAEAADKNYDIPIEDEAEDLLNPLRHPEYTVLIPRIVANLKPKGSKASPMLATELYVEASNQDCAIEIHERFLEVRDSLERVFEETTFDDIDSGPGKERLKVKIRLALDHFLTKGHVKRVFFSSINVSP